MTSEIETPSLRPSISLYAKAEGEQNDRREREESVPWGRKEAGEITEDEIKLDPVATSRSDRVGQ